jgi:hypothetical protein
MGVIGRSEIAFPQLIPYQNLTGYKIEKLLTLKPISMKGCCFITTATCEALGLDDDCEELATMRWFRDHVLATNDVGCRAIDEYYEIAPAIVAAIDQTQDSTTIYQDIYFLYLAPAVAAIHQGRHAEASDRYRQLVEMLQLRFGVTR